MTKEHLDVINASVQFVLALIALFALIYAIRQYGLSKKRYLEDSRPYIFVELAIATHGLLNIVISNTGKSAAVNIKVKFTPNIAIYEYSEKKINSYKFLKNLKFLAADRNFSFFFGSIIGGQTRISREFSINVSYEDVEGNEYSNDQKIDPRDLMDLVAISRKNIHDVATTLEDIRKEIKSSTDNSKKILNQLEKGIVKSDELYLSYDPNELISHLKNLLTVGVEGVYNTYPIESEAKIIAKIIRIKLLSKNKINPSDRKVLHVLNKFESSEFDFETQNIVDEFLKVAE